MSKLTKTLLALAVILLIPGLVISVGLVNAGGDTIWYVVLPSGAIFLGLFLISYLLEKETATFDAEHHAQAERIRTTSAVSALSSPPPAPPAPTDEPTPPAPIPPAESKPVH